MSTKRVMRNISKFIEEKLGLKVNMTKSKVDKPQGLKYLGFGFYFDSKAYQYKAKPHAKSVEKFKARMKHLCREIDKHIRYRLRMCIWKHWKTPQNRAKNLIKLEVPSWSAWKTAYLHGYAKPARCGDLHIAINNKRLASFGLISMLDYYTERCVTC